MIVRRIYYLLKPYIPWRFRMGMRRLMARGTLKKYQNIWPINAKAGATPTDWHGWPDGKKFAFLLTHDVEGQEGLEKCRQLAEVEMELGFRSSFNFIPEGDYKLPATLRSWLVGNGFEVGVHDLHHDGKLYGSRESFRSKARRINAYLKEWEAVGYRSGFMLRNLDWHHDLDIQYDATTFDIDPFEPQPGGTGTIFPFWVAAPQTADTANNNEIRLAAGEPARNGYTELPYTLPQDSTVFLLLQEKSPRIWIQKLDWVASCGGMALVNVHPDYLRFAGESPAPKTFPVDHYRQLLIHIRDRYQGTYWQPLPKDLAEWYAKTHVLVS